MKTIEGILQPTDGYINTFKRNTQEGWWELEVGLPQSWVFDENNKIGCEVLFENELGKLVKIFPKRKDIVIDDLIAFVEIIIDTNERIAEKEKEFKGKMEEMKGKLEKEAMKFYTELDELKENSFKNLNESFVKGLDKPKPQRKPRPPRTPKIAPSEAPSSAPSINDTVTEDTETLESTK